MTNPAPEPKPASLVELRRRSLAKALSWRVLATLVTAVLVIAMTGQWQLGAKIGVADTILKFLLYFGHERLWAHITFGRKRYQV